MPDPTAAAFEAALRDNPDDLTGWGAYADWLTERGDPRGDLIRVQLALENPALDRDERKKLRKRETALLDDHGREWVGKTLAKLLFGSTRYGLSGMREVEFRRGMLVALRGVTLTGPVAEAVGKSRALGWVSEVDARTPRGPADLAPLARAAFLPGLRRLRLVEGFLWNNSHDRRLPAVLARADRLERLELVGDPHRLPAVAALPFPHLTELKLVDLGEGQYPVAELAANPSLGQLRRLALHPPFSSNRFLLHLADLRALARSPHLTGLADLDFWQSDAGDAGCEELVASGLLHRLERLDLNNSRVTAVGAGVLLAGLRDRDHRLRWLGIGPYPPDPGLVAEFAELGVVLAPSEQRQPAPSTEEPAEPDDDYYDEDWE